MKIEMFETIIEREGGIFIATIRFEDGEKRVTQGKNIQELYNRISEVLCLRLNDDALSEDLEVKK
jgi:predicted RNase H-like HicB family nuclease